MAVKRKVTVSVQPINRRPSSAERRAAQVASLSTKQAQLKQEAAERAVARANRDAPAVATPREAAHTKRGSAR